MTGLVRHTYAQFLLAVKKDLRSNDRKKRKSKRERERQRKNTDKKKRVHLFKYRLYIKCCSNYWLLDMTHIEKKIKKIDKKQVRDVTAYGLWQVIIIIIFFTSLTHTAYSMCTGVRSKIGYIIYYTMYMFDRAQYVSPKHILLYVCTRIYVWRQTTENERKWEWIRRTRKKHYDI